MEGKDEEDKNRKTVSTMEKNKVGRKRNAPSAPILPGACGPIAPKPRSAKYPRLRMERQATGMTARQANCQVSHMTRVYSDTGHTNFVRHRVFCYDMFNNASSYRCRSMYERQLQIGTVPLRTQLHMVYINLPIIPGMTDHCKFREYVLQRMCQRTDILFESDFIQHGQYPTVFSASFKFNLDFGSCLLKQHECKFGGLTCKQRSVTSGGQMYVFDVSPPCNQVAKNTFEKLKMHVSVPYCLNTQLDGTTNKVAPQEHLMMMYLTALYNEALEQGIQLMYSKQLIEQDALVNDNWNPIVVPFEATTGMMCVNPTGPRNQKMEVRECGFAFMNVNNVNYVHSRLLKDLCIHDFFDQTSVHARISNEIAVKYKAKCQQDFANIATCISDCISTEKYERYSAQMEAKPEAMEWYGMVSARTYGMGKFKKRLTCSPDLFIKLMTQCINFTVHMTTTEMNTISSIRRTVYVPIDTEFVDNEELYVRFVNNVIACDIFGNVTVQKIIHGFQPFFEISFSYVNMTFATASAAKLLDSMWKITFENPIHLTSNACVKMAKEKQVCAGAVAACLLAAKSDEVQLRSVVESTLSQVDKVTFEALPQSLYSIKVSIQSRSITLMPVPIQDVTGFNVNINQNVMTVARPQSITTLTVLPSGTMPIEETADEFIPSTSEVERPTLDSVVIPNNPPKPRQRKQTLQPLNHDDSVAEIHNLTIEPEDLPTSRIFEEECGTGNSSLYIIINIYI